MSSVQNLRELINQRLTAAAEEIFTEFEKTIVQYEEEIDRQRRLLDNIWKPQITQHTAGLPQQHVCKEEKVLTGNQLNHQEMISSLDTEPPQIKEEQEELCNSLESQQLAPSQETHAFMLVQCKSKCRELSGEIFRVFENTLVQYEEKLYHQRRLLDVIWTPQMKLQSVELTQQHVCIEEDVVTEQQLCNQEIKSSLDHEDSKPPRIKEEQEEICTSVFQEDTELVQIKEEQEELCSNFDQEEPEAPQIKEVQEKLWTSPVVHISESECETDTGENSVKYDIGGKPRKHKSEVKELHGTDTDEKPYSCNKCGRTFNFCAPFKIHMRIHTGERPYSCKTCGKAFTRSDKLLCHMRTHTGEKPYLCNTCGKRFTDQSACKRHTAIHTGEKPHICNICGRRFVEKSDLNIHLTSHVGEKQHSCETCGKSFRHINKLLCHMRIHTGEKPFVCNTCGKRFTDPSGFKKHTTIHTGEKLHSCETCGKSFRHTSTLVCHKRTHTGERPFLCITCGNRFISNSNLKSHMRTHTGEKPYSCQTCGKDFTQSTTLKQHMRSHTGENSET